LEFVFKPYIKLYYLLWRSALIFSIIVGVFLFKSKEFLIIYMIISWLTVMLINLYEGRRLTNYLKEHHKDEYTKMKFFIGIEGVHNGFNMIVFLFSDDDYNDSTIIKLKSNYKKVILLIFAQFFSYPLLFIVMMFSII
jgi:hypothetical protein